MKKLLLALMLLVAIPSLVITSGNAAYAFSGNNGIKIPASQVPRSVKKTFHADFPNATQVEWEMTAVYYGGTTYTASFKNNGQKWEATFSADGALLSSGPKL